MINYKLQRIRDDIFGTQFVPNTDMTLLRTSVNSQLITEFITENIVK